MTKNIKVTVEGGKLLVEVDLTKRYGKSKSGKTTIVASTEGNIELEGTQGIYLGLNLYTKD